MRTGFGQDCAEKWSRDHKCADKIKLNALVEVFQQDDQDTLSVQDVHSPHS